MEAISRSPTISLVEVWEEEVGRMGEGLPTRNEKEIHKVICFSLLVYLKNYFLCINIVSTVWKDQIIFIYIPDFLNSLVKQGNKEHSGKADS